ncbi:restriction endonuclease subunit S [Burkholderia gladioli]|uniref:restriction endonuclease subunit S n=1 Tax=Burkholderia gladioli TaxID=28095 RepID=UPI00163F6BDC|nr:restriction endonuclease subunit S [Burkholderia gladioli]
MSLPTYADYKDSRIEWLGEVPAHWVCVRLATLFREVSEPGSGGMPVLSVSIHDGVSDRELDENEMERKVARSDDPAKYKAVAPGDLTYNMMRAWQGGFGTVTVYGMVSPAYVVARPMCDLLTSHIEMVLRTPMAISEIKRYSRGITDFRLRLYWEDFKGLQIALPPLAEQLAIASFLDRETGKIDALIAEQDKLLTLLAEKRQVTISHAVTRGLDPDVPTKDSGVAWLGMVPAHWEVGAVKRFFVSCDGRRIPLSAEERGRRIGDYPYYGASGVIDHVDEYIFDEDLVLVSEDGANLLNRATPIAFVARGKYWVNNHAHILKPLDDNLVFWAERIEAINLEPFVTGSAQPKLTIESLMNMVIAIPPTGEERAAIAEFILSAIDKLDALKGEAERSIDLLKERRSALIAAAVTGKIDVRNAVPQELAA